jgi:hypothetical protein
MRRLLIGKITSGKATYLTEQGLVVVKNEIHKPILERENKNEFVTKMAACS